MLRPYQQAAHDAAISWIKKSVDPCVIEAATGAGKSHIVAAIANTVHTMTGKRVLCLAPSKELVEQNHEKYILTGNRASIFSASAGRKCTRHHVVFGSPLTVKNSINRFKNEFCMVVIDECHGITPTIQSIIKSMREQNDKLRVVGLSATPWRLNTGYIYRIDEHGKPNGDDTCIDPYFTAKVFTITARELIDQGFLTPPVIGSINESGYETAGMKLNKMGKFSAADVDRAYHGHGRKTSRIIADIIAKSVDRKGVMIYAATVRHAQECFESMPKELSAIVTGETPKKEREKSVRDFKARRLKYLVNVGVFTTGFDASHVDVIAILRATESVGLLHQIIGRGLRIDPGKTECLVLDYAENIARHCPDGDIFDPKIEAIKKSEDSETVKAECESCGVVNEFTGRPNPDGFGIDENGYFVDILGSRIETDYGFMPAHYGRRCNGLKLQKNGEHDRCTYRWTYKECPECQADNDIAARYCHECHAEIVDPNEKLVSDFVRFKKDPTITQCDRVLSWRVRETLSKAGNACVVIDWVTEYRNFSAWYQKDSQNGFVMHRYEKMLSATNNMQTKPETIMYRKNASTGFYEILGYNTEADEKPEKIKCA